jgi:hypothetical protein
VTWIQIKDSADSRPLPRRNLYGENKTSDKSLIFGAIHGGSDQFVDELLYSAYQIKNFLFS